MQSKLSSAGQCTPATRHITRILWHIAKSTIPIFIKIGDGHVGELVDLAWNYPPIQASSL